ncbi:DUF547 domain-containing protein [Aurantibacter sp.]|uniref:DUF547 domain-containing protein n=1 Tax=Aurantibacter sp. TaxID=2807103 RepID=UPI00326752D9
MKSFLLNIFLFVLAFSTNMDALYSQDSKIANTNLNELSELFLKSIKDGKPTDEIQSKLSALTLNDLEKDLTTDTKKLAFWINIYNAYIQVILSEHPEKYEDRRTFFKAEQIPIAGRFISFAKIEHGIIRKSQWELGLGKIRKWFPNKFERKLRVEKRNYRIHFALNCGAKDCPPVAIYDANRLNEQLNIGTEKYLETTSEFNKENNEVSITSLFSWFRGDFGSKNDIKNILKTHGVIPTTSVDISYKNYDWTLDLHNWIKL